MTNTNKTPWKTDLWFTSPWDYDNSFKDQLNFADKIEIYDVTLRDGEQQAGVVFTKEQKIAIAKKLAEVGVHRIEAGMPAVSKEDEEAVKEIVKLNLGPDIYAFSRCMKSDIDLAVECGVKGVVTEIPCSEHMIDIAYQWPLERAIQQSIEVTKYAHEKGLRVVFFTIDASRADPKWFIETIKRIAAEGHMDALALADTMGVLSPHGAYAMVKAVKQVVDVPIEIHFHDDFGMGTAATLFGLAAGADVAHTCAIGLGERAGNTPYEDLVVSLKCLYGIDLGLDLTKISEMAKLAEELSGVKQRRNRAIFGPTLYAIESGILTGWYKNSYPDNPLEVTPFLPELVGREPVEIALGKLSGVPNIEIRMSMLGKDLPDKDTAKNVLADVKAKAAEVERELTDDEFIEILTKHNL